MKYRLSANNGEFLAAVASQGGAIVNGPIDLLQAHIDRGELVPILTQYVERRAGMYVVYPPGRLVAGRVRMLSDALHAHFQGKGIA